MMYVYIPCHYFDAGGFLLKNYDKRKDYNDRNLMDCPTGGGDQCDHLRR